ncbi:MAG: MarC family protein [Pseudomonadota bacterium]
MTTILLHWHDYLKVLVGLLAIVNPLLAIPAFIALTPDSSERNRRAIAARTALSVAIIIALTVVAGGPVLRAFGIQIAAFQVGGGILILLMAIAMLHARMSGARHTDDEAEEARGKEDIAVVPLALPLLAGPGAISTVIIYSHQDASAAHRIALIVIGLIVAAAVWAALRAALPVARVMGTTGLNIASRIMGLILAAIAVEFITRGLGVLLPGLAH